MAAHQLRPPSFADRGRARLADCQRAAVVAAPSVAPRSWSDRRQAFMSVLAGLGDVIPSETTAAYQKANRDVLRFHREAEVDGRLVRAQLRHRLDIYFVLRDRPHVLSTVLAGMAVCRDSIRAQPGGLESVGLFRGPVVAGTKAAMRAFIWTAGNDLQRFRSYLDNAVDIAHAAAAVMKALTRLVHPPVLITSSRPPPGLLSFVEANRGGTTQRRVVVLQGHEKALQHWYNGLVGREELQIVSVLIDAAAGHLHAQTMVVPELDGAR